MQLDPVAAASWLSFPETRDKLSHQRLQSIYEHYTAQLVVLLVVIDSPTSLCLIQHCPYKGPVFLCTIAGHPCNMRPKWSDLHSTSPNRKQDFLLSSFSTDLYHPCTPHPKPRGPPGGCYPTKSPTSAKCCKPCLILIYSGTFLIRCNSPKFSDTWNFFKACLAEWHLPSEFIIQVQI